MSLIPLSDLLRDAEKKEYALGAFNANNMEIVQAIIEAALEENAPVILQASQGGINYAGIELIVAMVKSKADKAGIPVTLHLDHGNSPEQIIKCLREGFSSVMFDGSALSLGENVSETRKVVQMAGVVGVSVEGELGRIGGTEDHVSVDEKEAFFTDPEEAGYFVRETGVDALAVAIGTAHGPYKGEPRLDFERLAAIRKNISVPVVLHGASGVPDDSIRHSISLGVRKINIDTELRQAFSLAVRKYLQENPDEYDPRKFLGPARTAVRDVVRKKIRLFGSAGRA